VYPEWSSEVSIEELTLLLNFRNVMKVAMLVISPPQHKRHLIELVTRMVEGTNMKYITGGGQTQETSHRVMIYERERASLAIPRSNRGPRTLSPSFSASGSDLGAYETSGEDVFYCAILYSFIFSYEQRSWYCIKPRCRGRTTA
jgi:hypothetical protein